MIYLQVEDVSKAYTERVLFDNITFSLDQGEKVALIGKNGTGKTTLLNIVAGTEDADDGTVYRREEITTSYFRQQEPYDPDASIFQTIFDSGSPVLNAIREFEESLETPDDTDRLHAAQANMDSIGAWDYEVRIKAIISKLKLDHLTQTMGKLSGGERSRVTLAKCLIEEPDLLIMDEPTNHLDLDMIEWLEEFLSKQKLTLLLVTHDRYFLESVCNRILELDDKKVYKHNGNYSYFVEHSAARKDIESVEITKAKNLFRKELDWMRRSPKARTTKAKARITSFYDLKETATKTIHNEEVQLHVLDRRIGSKVVEMYNVSKSFDHVDIIRDYTYHFRRNERLGIVGKNGSGKTTFLKMITGEAKPDSGKIVVGDTIVIGHYSQDIQLKENKRVIDVVRDIAETIEIDGRKQVSASKLLERFLFPSSEQYTPISKLSGGEKRRLALLTVLVGSPNFLILDEPTNDLDILTINILEEFLQEYKGVLVIVSHDRHFMDKLVDEMMVFEGGGNIRLIHGNYMEYRAQMQESAPAPVQRSPKKNREKTPQEKTRLTFKEKQEYADLEKEIASLEERKVFLNEQLNSGALDHEKLAEYGAELTEVMDQIDAKSMRWLELSEWAEE